MDNNRLKYLREEKEVTMLQVASALNIAKSTYSLWEEGKERIPLNRFIEICDYFNVSLDYMLNLTDIKNYKDISIGYDKNKLTQNLTMLRKDNKYTQNKFAQKLNLSRTTIINYEKGKTLPMLDHIAYLCEKYNISADYLLGRIDDPKYLK